MLDYIIVLFIIRFKLINDISIVYMLIMSFIGKVIEN